MYGRMTVRAVRICDSYRKYFWMRLFLKGRKEIHMSDLNEQLLDAWIRLSTTVINDRLVSEIPYNESILCNILYRSQILDPSKRLTATDLCRETGMLKSQMNRTLNAMERKGLISRERSDVDKRQVYLSFREDSIPAYQKQHEKIIALVDIITTQLGTQKTNEAIALFHTISTIAGDVLRTKTDRKEN